MYAFPDIEPEIVSSLSDWIDDNTVRVATRKQLPGVTSPARQVIVTVAMSNENSNAPLLRYAGVVIDCYADDYASASELAYLVESGLRSLTSENIKHVSITAGPSRMGEDSGQEHRAISAEVVVQAYDLN